MVLYFRERTSQRISDWFLAKTILELETGVKIPLFLNRAKYSRVSMVEVIYPLRSESSGFPLLTLCSFQNY